MTDKEFKQYQAERPDVQVTSVLELSRLIDLTLFDDQAEEPKRKWGNKPTQVDGYTFASRLEANRYAVLKVWQENGIITDLTTQFDNKSQHTWILLDACVREGRRQRPILYVDDFQYTQVSTGLYIIEDVKGRETVEFLHKQKMFRSRYPDVHFFVNHSIRGWYVP